VLSNVLPHVHDVFRRLNRQPLSHRRARGTG
jgi:hypothetical protein